MTTAGSTTAYAYNAAEELTSAGTTTYKYDPAGNRIAAGSTAYSYDDFGNLATETSGATTVAYQTNGAGLRVSATSGSTTTTYNWDAAAALPALLSDGTNGYLSADTALLAETVGSTNSYPLTDALSSVRASTDSAGSVTATASYEVDSAVQAGSSSVGSLGYTGALTDSSGLVYLNARSLDTTTGTFTSRDPETPGGPGITGFNPYAYAGQNPTTFTDPSGRSDEVVEYGSNLFNVAIRTIVSLSTLERIGYGAFILLGIIIGLGVGCVVSGPCTIPWQKGPTLPLSTLPRLPDLGRSFSQWWMDVVAKGIFGELVAYNILKGLRPDNFYRFHVYFPTSLGKRYLDICGYPGAYVDPQNPDYCVEVKFGNSPYTIDQMEKDAEITRDYHFPIIYLPISIPWPW